MHQLDTCDFCDRSADGVYEVLPPAVEADERRLALCDACRDTLAGVVDPLLDALDDGDAPDDDVTPATDDADRSRSRPAPTGVRFDSTPVDTDDTGDAAAESPSDAGADASPTRSASDRPTGYAKVVRLLRNRPAAMSRSDVAELADGAYDLTAAEVEAVVDAAVENGHLEETPEGVRAA